MRLEDSGGPQIWDIRGSTIGFFVQDSTNVTAPFIIEPGAPNNSIRIVSDGDIGIGTLDPDTTLEVTKSDGTAQILVDENGATAIRTLLTLENNGAPRMSLENSTSGNEWFFGMGGNDVFIISTPGTGGPELSVTANGQVRMGPGPTTNFQLFANGNATLDGILTQLSDVNEKQDLVAVDGREVLTQVATLPVTTWRYRDEETEARHLGPTAQDFHATFGLGEDDRYIAPSDMAGVALAAIKALQAENATLRGQYADLLERMAALEERLAGLN